MDITLTCNK